MKNIKEVMICWNPGTDQVELIPWPDRAGLSRLKGLRMSWGACNSHVHELSFEKRKLHIFIEAMHLIIRDRVDPDAVHKTFLGLEEYYDGCSDDMPGIKR